jgi:mannose-6-phosphate isomerase
MSLKDYPVKFQPIPQARIWGGDKLKAWFNATNMSAPIGEYWVLSGHPNGVSVAVNGEYAGKTLNELIAQSPRAYLGNSPQPRFPLLIKFLEATTDLSVQIHPNDEYAKQYEGDYGKTEAWYVLDCLDDGKVNFGHRFPNREAYLQAVHENHVKDFLNYEPIQKEQVVYVPAQTLHALLAGTTVIEVQQTSDVTYRVYDWDRVDDQGKPRQLHIEKAADVMQYGEPSDLPASSVPRVIERTSNFTHQRLLTCSYFALEKLEFQNTQKTLVRGNVENPDILIGVEGSGILRWEAGELAISRGDTVLIPTTVTQYELESSADLQVLRTFY